MSQKELSVVGSTRMAIGLSAVTKIAIEAQNYAYSLKILAGAGTLEITPIPATLGPGSSAAFHGLGYPVGANEIVNIKGAAVYYLQSTGATMTVGILIGKTQGASQI